MSQYDELKRLAEAHAQKDVVYPIESTRVMLVEPKAVLALIAENERLRVDLKSVVRLNNENADLFKAESERLESEAVYSAAGFDAAREEISKLRAEVAGLKTGYEAYERVNAELKAEVEALRKALTSSREFLVRDAKVRRMTDGARHISPKFPLRKLVMEQIDAALGKGEQS